MLRTSKSIFQIIALAGVCDFGTTNYSLISRQFSFCQVLTLSFGTPSTSTSLRSLFKVSSQSSSVTFFVPFVRPVASSNSVGAWRSRADLARRGLWK